MKKGKFRGVVKHVDGSSIAVELDVKYVPALWTNLISITTSLKNGSRLSANEGEILVLTKHRRKMKFDRKSRSGEGSTMSVIIEPLEGSLELVNAATKEDLSEQN
jgi:hypothetical protein